MCSIAEQAEACRIGYKMGLINTEEIKKWADGIIEKYDSFHPSIIDISLLSDHDKSYHIITKLETLSGVSRAVENKHVFEMVLILFTKAYHAGDISVERAGHILYQLAHSGWVEEGSIHYFAIQHVTRAFELAECGVYSLDDAALEMEHFLKPYVQSTAFIW